MENADGPGIADPGQQAERASKLNQVYLLIISRYKDYIEEKEEISVAELPRFVVPREPLVARKADDIRAQFGSYSYDENFDDAAKAAFRFVKDDIEEITLPLQFWLTAEEILTFMVGDLTDKSILLCSLLVALGNPSAKVLMVVRGADRDIKVYYEHGQRLTMFDISNDAAVDFQDRKALLATLDLSEDSDDLTAYEFNDQMYVDIM